MDKVHQQLSSICSGLQEKIEQTMEQTQWELKTQMMAVVDRKVVLLEAQMDAKYQEALQEITSTLQDIKDQVAGVCDGEENMWRAIDNMGKKLQELAQEDAGTDEEDNTEQALASTDSAEDRPANPVAVVLVAP